MAIVCAGLQSPVQPDGFGICLGFFATPFCIPDLCVPSEPGNCQDRRSGDPLRGICDDRNDALANVCRVDPEPSSGDHGGQADAGENQFSA